ncbi:MAG: nucleotidyltransferase family protein [Acidobacteria bacterium]|nr:nucleotidyltransferase family protein [Acidobacteriota bacterium]
MEWINRSSVLARPEWELLLCCARTSPPPETVERIRALVNQELDWDFLFRHAAAHKLSPLLCWHLKTQAADLLPPRIQTRIQTDLLGNSRLNLSHSAELLRILKLFEEQGIAAIPYKGPILAETVYGNLSLRAFVDLDLLVRKRDVLRARELLVANGYESQFQLAESQEQPFLDYQCEHVLFHPDRDLMVEIQWRVVPNYFSFRFDYERLWTRLTSATFCNRQIAVLSPEDTLLVLCVHGAKHLWERIGWIADVAEAIRHFQQRQTLNWDVVRQRAAQSGSQRMLFLGLFLAHDLLDIELPEVIRQLVSADAAVSPLAEKIYARLWTASDGEAGFFERSFFHLQAKERWQDKVRFCFRVLTTTTIEDWISAPKSFSSFTPLLLLRRGVRLLRKYIPELFRLLFSR